MKLITKESTLSSLLALGVIARASAITIVRSSAIPSSSSDHVRIEKGLDMVELLKRHNKNATSEYFIESSLEELDESVSDEGYNSIVLDWEKESGAHSDDNSYDMYMKSNLYIEPTEVERNGNKVEIESSPQEINSDKFNEVLQAYTLCLMDLYQQDGAYSDVRKYDEFIGCLEIESVDQVDRVSYEAYNSCLMKTEKIHFVDTLDCLYSAMSYGVETNYEEIEMRLSIEAMEVDMEIDEEQNACIADWLDKGGSKENDEGYAAFQSCLSQDSFGVEEQDDEEEIEPPKATNQLESDKERNTGCVESMAGNKEFDHDDFLDLMACLEQKYMKIRRLVSVDDFTDFDGINRMESNETSLSIM